MTTSMRGLDLAPHVELNDRAAGVDGWNATTRRRHVLGW
jgi:hypothetical protein